MIGTISILVVFFIGVFVGWIMFKPETKPKKMDNYNPYDPENHDGRYY